MTPVTEWFLWNPHDRKWSFNHLTNGHEQTDKPIPKMACQSTWANGKWLRYHRWLTDDRKVVSYSEDEQ